MPLTQFKHKTPIQIRFSDVDMMGHVNNANYFSYVELARLKYFDEVIGSDTDWHTQHGLIMARFEIDYKKAIKYDDQIAVYTRCSHLGTKSFELSWVIASDDALFAEGKTVVVCFDYEIQQSKKIPEDRRLKIKEYEALALK